MTVMFVVALSSSGYPTFRTSPLFLLLPCKLLRTNTCQGQSIDNLVNIPGVAGQMKPTAVQFLDVDSRQEIKSCGSQAPTMANQKAASAAFRSPAILDNSMVNRPTVSARMIALYTYGTGAAERTKELTVQTAVHSETP